MKKVLSVVAAVLLLSGVALAAEHNHDHSTHDHNAHSGAKSESGNKSSNVVLKAEKNGIKVNATLNDMQVAMKEMSKNSGMKMDTSKMDQNVTHHIAVMIDGSEKSGKVKKADLKLTLNKKTSKYELAEMMGHYGSDLSLKEKGSYKAVITVETEKSGKTEFSFTLKN